MTAMNLALSLDCSFLDLSNDDPAYDSPTSSQEDEPLDSKVLPIPPRQKIKRHRRRQSVFHNELSSRPYSLSSSCSGRSRHRSCESGSLLNLSDIYLPLENCDHWSMSGSVNYVVQRPIASSSSSYPSSLRTIYDQCENSSESYAVLQTTSLTHGSPSREPEKAAAGKMHPSNFTTSASIELPRNSKKHAPHHYPSKSDRNAIFPPLENDTLLPAANHLDHMMGEAARMPKLKRTDSGINGSCSIKLVSSFALPEKSSSLQVESAENLNSAANFEIVISSGPLANIDPNQPLPTTLPLKLKSSGTKDKQPGSKTDFLSQKNVAWVSNLSDSKENRVDGFHVISEDE
ncbi:hypothetical protein PCANC_07651 [Puccinia coronata f. sp. avenae]|uniref:Uncharacterized protein n=1 Tax=Puccinia coronata f. sp. avenae TaxID=200324 RepID=A0A2N5UTC4_9BASI|nr:hypothetical protein PCASD_19492 [Puccinia coronata f. sp. avenae]PLW19730.1 hypothetical protein PCANC_07651 [Puccinia coronata f. sp. avenae]PLW40993.1 hypothetical protein PCASD_06596 [Puccinia coronata f. sp. avenae]